MPNAVLLANVGNHDLQLNTDQLNLLPPQQDSRYWTPRRLGEEIMRDFKRYRDALELPLLHPTLKYLHQLGFDMKQEVRLFLFASNQNRDLASESEWLKDTYPLAQVIQEYCDYHWKIPKKLTRITEIQGSPADYANMLAFYQEKLPILKKHLSADAQVFLEVSGGTPAMTSMLILIGVETFGQDVTTLYLDRSSEEPYQIGIAQSLFARKTRQTIRQEIGLYAYVAAQQTLQHYGALVLSDERERRLLGHLLEYAGRRLAFDYERARKELHQASALAVGETQSLLRYALRELKDPIPATHLSELIHSAAIKLHLGDYADFTQRLFRFQEAIFRFMAEQMGIQYGKGSQYLSQAWRENLPALDQFLNHYNRSADGQPPKDGKPIKVETDRSLNRFSLGAFVDFFVQQTKWQHWQTATEKIHALSKVADLRNKGIAGHGFEGIGLEDLEKAYGSPADNILADTSIIYQDIFGEELSNSPYDHINQLCLDLLEERA